MDMGLLAPELRLSLPKSWVGLGCFKQIYKNKLGKGRNDAGLLELKFDVKHLTWGRSHWDSEVTQCIQAMKISYETGNLLQTRWPRWPSFFWGDFPCILFPDSFFYYTERQSPCIAAIKSSALGPWNAGKAILDKILTDLTAVRAWQAESWQSADWDFVYSKIAICSLFVQVSLDTKHFYCKCL